MAVAAGEVFAQRHVDAAAPPGRDVGRERDDVAAAGAAVHAVVPVVAVDEVEAAAAAVDGVDAEAARHLVVLARAAEERVVAEVPDHPVVAAGAAVGEVVAAAAVDQVGAGPAAEQVVAEAAEDHVISPAAPDHVPPGCAVQLVGAVGADDAGVPPVAARDFVLGCLRAAFGGGCHSGSEHRRGKRAADRCCPDAFPHRL